MDRFMVMGMFRWRSWRGGDGERLGRYHVIRLPHEIDFLNYDPRYRSISEAIGIKVLITTYLPTSFIHPLAYSAKIFPSLSFPFVSPISP